ncbi:nuclear transport factor 2 family protein [Pedobacter rhodius]|uniref:Nuclear transport factor 2 family protein n=1 Tax=Pedobacter rhodius TaxID=3004098 RepID=A0ABT4L0A5_9SPHI|nr:nuclear transport factor 2 family protein [Pedobacter sp. SJ11]MCZ4223892.1 nuclear transport factor 2 family protein [Pedobacter sp. SJ11]
MKSVFVLALICAFFGQSLKAQSPDEDAVKKTVNNLFLGMKTGDSTLAASAFAPNSILQTIVSKDGKNTVRTEPVPEFIKFIGTPHKQKYDERIVFTKVLIDGPLASVWTDYKFYVDEQFSHCGVNSFQLVKGEKGWQIVYIIDTRRKDQCKS